MMGREAVGEMKGANVGVAGPLSPMVVLPGVSSLLAHMAMKTMTVIQRVRMVPMPTRATNQRLIPEPVLAAAASGFCACPSV